MACMAINYNVMVSLDISVGNPTWPNPDVLSYVRALAYAPPFDESISERKRQQRGISILSSRYLPSLPRTKRSQQCELRARNCPSASALIECLVLSLRISYVVDMKNGENRGYEGGDRERATFTKVWGEEKEEETSRRTFASAASSDNTWREREGKKYLRNSHINNYCYSVMTDVGHGKTR